MRKTAAGFEASVEKERRGDSAEKETERTELRSRASRREGKRGNDRASDGPCSPHGSTRLPIRLPEPGTQIWALSGAQARPGFVCWTLREIS